MSETDRATPRDEAGRSAPATGSASPKLPARPAPNGAPSAASSAPARPSTQRKDSGAPQSIGVRGYPESVTRLIDELAKLPGIGRRSAERLAFHILKAQKPAALALAKAIEDVKLRVRHCRVCYNLADSARDANDARVGHTTDPSSSAAETPAPAERDGTGRLCAICHGATLNPPSREGAVVMVVEQPKDLIALEQTGMYKGVYHVLMGRISPLEGVGAGDLTVHDLLDRIDTPSLNAGSVPVQEVVLALNPTMEGDGTALYLQEQLARRNIRVTRLARGLPTGSQLEYASKAVLADAIQGRRGV